MADIAHMRRLLGEMRRLSAAAEAPTKLEGAGDVLLGAAKVYHEDMGFMSAGWLTHLCHELLSRGGEGVSDNLRYQVLRLQQRLQKVESVEQWTPNKRDADDLKAMQPGCRWAVYYQYKAMLSEVRKAVESFVTTEGLNWEQMRAELTKRTHRGSTMVGFVTSKSGDLASDTFAVALSAFLTGIHTYLNRYINKNFMLSLYQSI